MSKLFGTDGIRGEVGKYPLRQGAVFTIGRTLGLWLKQQYPEKNQRLKIIIGKDTRESADWLELALVKGVQKEGLDVVSLGVCPTPGVAYLTPALGAHLGLAISASHNPSTDNGIKFFAADGYKLFPFAEQRIEEIFFTLKQEEGDLDLKSVHLTEDRSHLSLYFDFIKNSLNHLDLAGKKVVLDCAFGSFSQIAPAVLHGLGMQVEALNNRPDGKNINVNCGTLYPQAMAERTRQTHSDIGIAFDGDGDRVIVADEKGNILDGDFILAILGKYFFEQNRLGANSVVCTQMSNIGLELFFRELGIGVTRTAVGDKYVLQEMLKQQANLGGEQSGHIIILERTTTGDGLIVTLELIRIMLEAGKPLSELVGNLRKFPQMLLNVKVKEKLALEKIPGLNEITAQARQQLAGQGRLLVRYSGTENLARIMVEGNHPDLISRVADSVSRVIRQAIGEGQ